MWSENSYDANRSNLPVREYINLFFVFSYHQSYGLPGLYADWNKHNHHELLCTHENTLARTHTTYTHAHTLMITAVVQCLYLWEKLFKHQRRNFMIRQEQDDFNWHWDCIHSQMFQDVSNDQIPQQRRKMYFFRDHMRQLLLGRMYI